MNRGNSFEPNLHDFWVRSLLICRGVWGQVTCEPNFSLLKVGLKYVENSQGTQGVLIFRGGIKSSRKNQWPNQGRFVIFFWCPEMEASAFFFSQESCPMFSYLREDSAFLWDSWSLGLGVRRILFLSWRLRFSPCCSQKRGICRGEVVRRQGEIRWIKLRWVCCPNSMRDVWEWNRPQVRGMFGGEWRSDGEKQQGVNWVNVSSWGWWWWMWNFMRIWIYMNGEWLLLSDEWQVKNDTWCKMTEKWWMMTIVMRTMMLMMRLIMTVMHDKNINKMFLHFLNGPNYPSFFIWVLPMPVDRGSCWLIHDDRCRRWSTWLVTGCWTCALVVN